MTAPAWLALAAAPPPSPEPALGVWANPKATIEVRTRFCGADLCGAIVGATPQALADAKRAGVARLIGTELLRDYRKTAAGAWSGTVFVPDMGRSFSSRIVQLGNDRLRISGCLIAGFFCKSQLWHRVA